MRPEIAVTTTPDRFDRWAAPLAASGFRPLPMACIEVRPVVRGGDVRGRMAGADWIMVTSPRAVEILWSGEAMPPVPVAVVGESTAEAVRSAGGRVALIGDGDGNRLVELLAERSAGRRVVFPHGARADTGRLAPLLDAGAQIDAMVIYETRPVTPPSDPVSGAVFGSPSAVEGWSLSRSLTALRLVGAIGRVTAGALRERGVDDLIVSPRPDPESLAETMSAHLERSP